MGHLYSQGVWEHGGREGVWSTVSFHSCFSSLLWWCKVSTDVPGAWPGYITSRPPQTKQSVWKQNNMSWDITSHVFTLKTMVIAINACSKQADANGGRLILPWNVLERGVKGLLVHSFMGDVQVKRQSKQWSLMTQVIGPLSPNRVVVWYWVTWKRVVRAAGLLVRLLNSDLSWFQHRAFLWDHLKLDMDTMKCLSLIYTTREQ